MLKNQVARLMIFVCLTGLMLGGTLFADQSDDFTLTVSHGEPEANPNPASIKEDVSFQFKANLIDKKTGKVEETPSDVKSVSYSLTSDAEKITSCTPSMTISTDEKSASETTTTLQNVTAVLRYAAEGEHTLTLDVTVTFKDDSTLSGSYTITVNAYRITLNSPNVITIPVPNAEDKRIVPITFNNDQDCAKEYTLTWSCSANCPDGCDNDHRELEPVWDYRYIGSYADGDIVPVTVDFFPKTLGGNVELKAATGGSKIRIWDQANKGNKSHIVPLPVTFPVADLPKTFYVEGTDTGNVSFVAEYKGVANPVPVTLYACVVALVERQGDRKIIYDSQTPINFTVEGGSALNGYFSWTVPQHQTPSSLGSANTINVSYGSTGCNVILPEDAANRRFTSTVSVAVGNLTLSQGIRVAQSGYRGTAVAGTTSGKRTEVAGLATLPAMDPLPASGTFAASALDNQYGTDFVSTGNTQIQYATSLPYYGLTVPEGSSVNMKIYAVMISEDAYAYQLKLEDLTATAQHEIRHVYQLMWIRNNNNNNWQILESNLPVIRLAHFMEADAYATNLNSNASWRYINTRFEPFRKDNYTPANNRYAAETNAVVKQAMREILQDVYKRARVAFPEMQHRFPFAYRYHWRIRPPENPEKSAASQIFISP